MKAVETHDATTTSLDHQRILEQLQRMVQDEVFRSSKRSVAFLTYVVHEALRGSDEPIKERNIGAEVFGRSSSYDTNLDHIVRTAATEVRKRIAIYYGNDLHRGELHISLVPGSYLPQFSPPKAGNETASDALTPVDPHSGSTHSAISSEVERPSPTGKSPRHWFRIGIYPLCAVVVVLVALGLTRRMDRSPITLFWQPTLNTPGPVLVVVGDVPNGPPVLPNGQQSSDLPVPRADPIESLPFGDAMTTARVVSSLEIHGKKVLIRRGSASSFSDLRQGAVVLIGAFNNEWSLRLTRPLEYSLALDPARHLIYIRDSKNPSARNWSWATNQPPAPTTGINSPKLYDYALISRIQSSETGHPVVVIGGLYAYGTQAAGEFLANPKEMRTLVKALHEAGSSGNLQIVLETTVTDGTPGPPRVVSVSIK